MLNLSIGRNCDDGNMTEHSIKFIANRMNYGAHREELEEVNN